MEKYFKKFRENTLGNDFSFKSPYGIKKIIYADWIASGRLYKPIEERISNVIGPFIGNTHTETTETGTLMTNAYHYSHQLIKKHVNAGPNDVIITTGFGMTGAINKFQRILGLKHCQPCVKKHVNSQEDLPVVFITHMEHHSNQTSWYETVAEVVQIPFDTELRVDLEAFSEMLERYKNRKLKIGAFTACSNVTGIMPPYHKLAAMIHEHNGVCFIDFAASAPYVDINMHPENPMEKLDAILFSPHKFLGGPGSSGVLIFDSSLYKSETPDHPGGGTVDWTNPWGEYKYIDDIELREDGGTPGFLQSIKTALAIQLKEEMGVKNILAREHELLIIAFEELPKIKGMNILADNIRDRLGIISFYLEGLHYNLVVKILNDRFGIQMRGGCACAGTYGHYLLDVSYEYSHEITQKINFGDLSEKPGWVRMSLHPTMTNEELYFIIDALHQLTKNADIWMKDYIYDKYTNEFRHQSESKDKTEWVKPWFKL